MTVTELVFILLAVTLDPIKVMVVFFVFCIYFNRWFVFLATLSGAIVCEVILHSLQPMRGFGVGFLYQLIGAFIVSLVFYWLVRAFQRLRISYSTKY